MLNEILGILIGIWELIDQFSDILKFLLHSKGWDGE